MDFLKMIGEKVINCCGNYVGTFFFLRLQLKKHVVGLFIQKLGGNSIF